MASIFNDLNFLSVNPKLNELTNNVCAQLSISIDDFEQIIHSLNSTFILLSYNIRSINKKENFDGLVDLLASMKANKNNVDVIVITETWATLDDINNGMFDIPGFAIFSDCRLGQKGGGVAVYVSSNYNCS